MPENVRVDTKHVLPRLVLAFDPLQARRPNRDGILTFSTYPGMVAFDKDWRP